MEWLIGKLPSISTAIKGLKKIHKLISFTTLCPKIQNGILVDLVFYGLI
jgi:hypothetical protein